MKIQVDEARFDALQMEVGYAILHEVHTALKKAGAPDGEQLEAAGALFHIGCLLDGSAEVKGPDWPMQVVLTFRRNQEDSTLVSAGGTSWIHEYAHGIAEDYFDKLRARPARRPTPPAKAEKPGRNPFGGFLMMVRDISVAAIGAAVLVVTKRKGFPFVTGLLDWRLFENPFLLLEDVTVPVVEFESTSELAS